MILPKSAGHQGIQGAPPEKPSLARHRSNELWRKEIIPKHRWIINDNGSHHGSYIHIYIMAYVQLNLRKNDDSMMNMCSSVLGPRGSGIWHIWIHMAHVSLLEKRQQTPQDSPEAPNQTRMLAIMVPDILDRNVHNFHDHPMLWLWWLWWSQTSEHVP